jgi:N-terminal domain of toast_rack, DUF2154
MFEELGRHLDNLVRRVTDSSGMTEIDPRTDTIAIPCPDSAPIKLRLDIGVGKLNVTPGRELLVEGTATYNVEEWAPQTTVEGGNVALKQGQAWAISPVWGHVQNDWELKLGTTQPFELSIGKGVTTGTLALGGIPLTGLSVDVGAAESRITFDKPNPERADRMEFKSGAGEAHITGLLNANAALAYVRGGAGKTYLGFTGDTLKADMKADVNLSVGEAIVEIKAGIPARVTISQGLGGIKVLGPFCMAGDRVYETPDFATTSGPKLVMKVSTGVGSVTVKTT